MAKAAYLLSFLLFFFYFQYRVESDIVGHGPNTDVESNSLHVGVILNLKSPMGTMTDICISMAIRDFYAMHSDYQTRLFLHTRDAEDVVSAASAALDLLKNVEVQALLLPQRSDEARFVIELAENAHVPALSFSATNPSLSPTQNSYFIRTALSDSSQVKAIAAIIQKFEWQEVVLMYEDTEYGNGIIPFLIDALQEIEVQVPHMSAIPIYAEDTQISKELNKLMTMQTKVFLVHMTSTLGSRLFVLADKAGMMSEGYAWLMTDGLSNSLDAMDPLAINSMEGVLGIRPHVPKSKNLDYFIMRWKRNLTLLKPNESETTLNIFGLWAYDTIWTLAMAVEKLAPMNSSFLKLNNGKSATDLSNLGISNMGPRIVNKIRNTKSTGLSGEFHLVNGQLQPSSFEILNVLGKGERIIGYWIPIKGLSRELSSNESITKSTFRKEFKKIIWAGDTTKIPKGWAIPKLRIGVPAVNGFTQFVEVIKNPDTNNFTCQGFSIDVFLAVIQVLASTLKVDYEFIPFIKENGESAGTYDELLWQIYEKKVDGVVGDTTIVANRTSFVDFTLPYTESGVTMLVPIKHGRKSMWIFLQPLSWDLWLVIILCCIIIGVVIRILEHHTENTESRGPSRWQVGMILWFPCSSLVLPRREMVNNQRAQFVLVVWLFLAFILMQSYSASLSSKFTFDLLQPAYVSVHELKTKGYYVGYQNESFVKNFLVKQLKFNETKLKSYRTIAEYHKALSKGSDKGGVAAIFDEIPYVRVFLAKYGSKYTMTGPTYRTDGFGFAFPLNSPLVSHFSRAVLNVTEGPIMDDIEVKYFGHRLASLQQTAPFSSDSPILRAYNFGGLFIITGIATLLALIASESYIWQKPIAMAKQYSQKYLSFQASNKTEPVADSMAGNVNTQVPEVDNTENNARNSNQNGENVSIEERHVEEGEIHSS